MHIIAGELKSRIIKTHKSQKVRPTTGRVRQTLFDLLSTRFCFEGARCLDLFAGSGILGFEAISRGAERVTFIDSSALTVKTILSSASSLSVSERVAVLKMNALSFLIQTTDVYDLIFCDPPYAFKEDQLIIDRILDRKLLSENGYFILEHPKSKSFENHQNCEFTKQFGTTSLSFFSCS